MNLNTIDLTPILQAVIALLAAIITAKVIPWIKSKTTAQQQSALMTTVRILVYAAEQLYGAGKGEEKLDYVCDQLRARGYDVNRAEIEATVYSEFTHVLKLCEMDDSDKEVGAEEQPAHDDPEIDMDDLLGL